jgi:hypothetical protein
MSLVVIKEIGLEVNAENTQFKCKTQEDAVR